MVFFYIKGIVPIDIFLQSLTINQQVCKVSSGAVRKRSGTTNDRTTRGCFIITLPC